MRVRIFTHWDTDKLEIEVNDWIGSMRLKHGLDFQIVERSMSQSVGYEKSHPSITVAIWYEA